MTNEAEHFSYIFWVYRVYFMNTNFNNVYVLFRYCLLYKMSLQVFCSCVDCFVFSNWYVSHNVCVLNMGHLSLTCLVFIFSDKVSDPSLPKRYLWWVQWTVNIWFVSCLRNLCLPQSHGDVCSALGHVLNCHSHLKIQSTWNKVSCVWSKGQTSTFLYEYPIDPAPLIEKTVISPFLCGIPLS